MSGAMRKMGVYLGLLEDVEGDYADERSYDAYDEPEQTQAPAPVARPVSNLHDRRRTGVAQPATASMPLSRIVTLHPRTYNEARVIGENFRDGIPVIRNLTEMSDADAKRLVDFAAGLVFSVRGSIDRVTQRVFLLTPPNVSVDAEEKERAAESGFFNQS
ncbi:MAG: cell division protein SepF [Marmoricola sp.]